MRLTNRAEFARVALALIAVGICYAGVITSLVDVWTTNYVYSYGFMVPVIAAYIVWAKSHERRWTQAAPDYKCGVPVTLAGIAMLIMGRLSAIITLEQASLIVTLTGLALLLFGRETVKSNWFAIAYLFSMVPMWGYVVDQLQNPSRILSATIAAHALQVVGVPALLEGTTLVLPSHTLAVMRECSGVNQLIAVGAMVLPIVYLWLDTNLRRGVLILFAVAVSYLGNGFRIALVGWLASQGLGDGSLNGPYHLLEGLGVSVLEYLAIGACFSLLSRLNGRTPSAPVDDTVSTFPSAAAFGVRHRRVWLDAAVISIILAAGVAPLSAAATQRDVHLTRDLSSLESRIDEWTMETDPEAVAVPFPVVDDDLLGAYPTATGGYRFTAVDDELVRTYQSDSGARVQLYIGYYHRQHQGKELTGDTSSLLQAAASNITLSTNSGPLELKEVVREENGRRRGVLYWYDLNGQVISDIYQAKGRTIWSAITRGRTNAAVVMLAWEGPESSRENAQAFARALVTVLPHYFPS